jgi:hypothetical protein
MGEFGGVIDVAGDGETVPLFLGWISDIRKNPSQQLTGKT